MGTYLPQTSKRKRSVSQALREAEEEHLLDCPNADPASIKYVAIHCATIPTFPHIIALLTAR